MTDRTDTALADDAAILIESLMRAAQVGEHLARKPDTTSAPGEGKTQWVSARMVLARLESEYRDERCEPDGEWLAKEARPVHDAICAALFAGPPRKSTPEEQAKAIAFAQKVMK